MFKKPSAPSLPPTPPPEHHLPNATLSRSRSSYGMEVNEFVVSSKINTMFDVEKFCEKLAMKKAHTPLPKIAFLGILAGWWCGLAVLLVSVIAGGVPAEVRAAWPMLPKLIAGILFPAAICFIVLYGGELLTGNMMYMTIGWLAKRVTVKDVLINWSVVLVANFVGNVATVYFFGYLAHLFADEPWLAYVQGVAVYKVKLLPEVAFLRGVPANALVCTCVLFGLLAKEMIGKIVSNSLCSVCVCVREFFLTLSPCCVRRQCGSPSQPSPCAVSSTASQTWHSSPSDSCTVRRPATQIGFIRTSSSCCWAIWWAVG